jgi:hypothetical protein
VKKLTNYVPQGGRTNKVSKYNFGELVNITDKENGIAGDVIIYKSTLDGHSVQDVTALGKLLSSAAASYMKAHPSRFQDTKLVKFTDPDFRTDPVTGSTVEGLMVGVYLSRR